MKGISLSHVFCLKGVFSYCMLGVLNHLTSHIFFSCQFLFFFFLQALSAHEPLDGPCLHLPFMVLTGISEAAPSFVLISALKNASCSSAVLKGNTTAQLCFSWEAPPFGMENSGWLFLFCLHRQNKQGSCITPR